MRATSPYLNRPLRTYAQALAQIQFERAVRSLMWEQGARDQAIAKWQREAETGEHENGHGR